MKSGDLIEEKDRELLEQLQDAVKNIRAERRKRRLALKIIARRINIATDKIRDIEREERSRDG